MILYSGLSELNNYLIHLEWHLTSNHTLLSITISIVEENINSSKFSIAKNSEEEMVFIKDVITFIKSLDVSNLSDINRLENIVNTFAFHIEYVWEKNSKLVNITRYSKSWWNKDCN